MKYPRYVAGLFCAAGLLASAALASESSATMSLTIDTTSPGPTVPNTFLGSSISSMSIDGDSGYQQIFQSTNSQLVNLFQQIGIKHVRTIMGPASSTNYNDPTDSQIDSFFSFISAAGVQKVIWSGHLFNEDENEGTAWANNNHIMSYIWGKYSSQIDSFAFDNEPDWHSNMCCSDPYITNYYTDKNGSTQYGYKQEWEELQANAASLVPGAQFSGPDTGCIYPVNYDGTSKTDTAINGKPFTLRFALDENSHINEANQHFYCQSAGTLSTVQLAGVCLSSDWVTTKYQLLYNNALAGYTDPTYPWPSGLNYRFTECSPLDSSGNPGCMAYFGALWGLDFFHWWARHGAVGIDAITRCPGTATGQYNSPINIDSNTGNYIALPYAYGMKMFGMGSNGNVIYTGKFVVSKSPSTLNATAYGVVNAHDLYVTVVNKTYNSATGGSYKITVSIPKPNGFTVNSAQYCVLGGGTTAGNWGDATMAGANIGGLTIPNSGTFGNPWQSLAVNSDGSVTVTVHATTAALIDLHQN